MRDQEIINKNLSLHYHLMMQLLRDPDSLDVPDGAEVLFLPDDDHALREANLRLGKRREKAGATVVYVKVRLVPETRTVLTPHLSIANVA